MKEHIYAYNFYKSTESDKKLKKMTTLERVIITHPLSSSIPPTTQKDPGTLDSTDAGMTVTSLCAIIPIIVSLATS